MNGQWVVFAAVAFGGALGAMLRYAVTQLCARPGDAPLFAALAVNVVGCLIAGFASVWLEARLGPNAWLKPLLLIGFAGSLTTFSAFGLDIVGLLRADRAGFAAGLVATHLVLGIGAVFVGIATALTVIESA